MKRFIRIGSKIALALIVVLLLLFGIGYLLTRGHYQVAQTVAQNKDLPRFQCRDALLHLECFGNEKSDLIIVLHGGPGNDYRYLLPLKDLSDQYRVLFYDQRGSGLSARVPEDQLSLETLLSDLEYIVERFSSDRPVNLIGHSWGAMLATAYIARHPEKVAKAVLAEPGMLTSQKAKEFMEKFQIKPSLRLLWNLARIWLEQLHIDGPDDQAGMDYFFTELAKIDDPQNPLAGYACEGRLNPDHFPYWRFSWTSSQAIVKKAKNKKGEIIIDLVRGLEYFPRKVLFLCGACNRIIGPDFQQDHMEAFPSAEMVVIENAGHNMITEKPTESLAAIRRYLQEN